jgi:hypothetical protein
VRADGQEPDSRHAALDELAKDGKVQFIKDVACKFGGCAPKVVELTSGDLSLVAKLRLRNGAIHPDRAGEVSRGRSTHENGEGPNGPPQRRVMGVVSRRCDS